MRTKRKDLQEILVTSYTSVVDKQEIAENLNKYFSQKHWCQLAPTDVVSKTINEEESSEKYFENCNIVMSDTPITNEKVRNTF